MIKAVINIDSAPRHHVYNVLTDYARYREWLPGCEQSKVLSSSGDTADTEITINSMKKMTLGLRFEGQPTQVLSFRMVSGKEIKAYSGAYRFMDSADGKGTVVVAEMEIDAGAMVPKFMVDRMAKKSIEDTGNALRKYIPTLPVQAPPAGAPQPVAAAAAPQAASKPRRARRILQVVKTSDGYRVWMNGESYVLKNA